MADKPSHTISRQTRRTVLAAMGGGATAALAGCIGGDDGGVGQETLESVQNVDTIRMKTSQRGTTAHTALTALASVLNDELEGLSVEAQTSDGTEENLGDIANGDIEMGFLQNWTARQFREGVGDFGEFEMQLSQLFHYYDLPWFFITSNFDLETLSDIGSGNTISPTPSGSGTAPGLEYALQEPTGGNYERISVGFTSQGGAMNEGRLDVGVGTLLNSVITPGWLQEAINSVDQFRVLDVQDSTASAWEDDDKILSQTIDMTQLEGSDKENVDVPNEVAAPTFSYNFVSRAELDPDAVTNFLETMWEARDALAEEFGIFNFHRNAEFWVKNPYEGIPFHPSAAEFYRERGVWNDDWEVADV
ncbi:C4-dicarboxylate ABC transporter substrate-binding protein [Halovenus sp. WSH3]|uniref:C4-dicarboxylate ABC transporter substrate-binding protein n=1 Tax=Halovenus carboxidivorans TaxID=2692199 RepID=A0A6B0TFG6_9EURY|nr:TAXI family TRAP transporter solute-binding subunit [Halovenus carboxidivorans]MXR51929.1 C4-dicarboxylate ABC transporter substrate-binding protein [Halovenus carboxidivorans]